jgi:Zn-finger nucleic acid-binding protein
MAKCPVCKNVLLEPAQLEGSLPVMKCNACGGAWLRANEYTIWLRSQSPVGIREETTRKISKRSPVVEANKAAICPDCGHLLRKFKVGSKVDFHLDRCNNCNGVWFDQDEWQVLILADLHDEISKIFTAPWQKQIQDELTAGMFDAIYRERFGAEDYEKIKVLREWLEANPNRGALLAFLQDRDPYSA